MTDEEKIATDLQAALIHAVRAVLKDVSSGGPFGTQSQPLYRLSIDTVSALISAETMAERNADAVRLAVAAEREACAALLLSLEVEFEGSASRWRDGERACKRQGVEAIRKRGQP